MREVVIVGAARLAVGKLGGTLKNSSEAEMGAVVIKEAINRAGISPDDVDEIIMAHNYRSGHISGNSTRVMALKAGIPEPIPEFTINKHCGGSIKSITLAAQVIKSGDADVIVAGGVELMSAAAFLVPDIRWGNPLGHGKFQDQLVLYDPICGLTMGQTAEKLAGTFDISREDMDQFAYESQQKAERAIKEGCFSKEIVAFEIPQQKGDPLVFDTDEYPRFGTTLEALARLKPAFKQDGRLTAGNSCGMNDGAAALVVMSAEKAEKLGVKPLVQIRGYNSVGVDPSIMGIGPVPSTKKVLEKTGLSIRDIDLIEINEAFAVVCLHFLRETGADPAKLNVDGGAIALGHPISATGAVLATKLVHQMELREVRLGLVAMCIGGGQGIAMVLERV